VPIPVEVRGDHPAAEGPAEGVAVEALGQLIFGGVDRLGVHEVQPRVEGAQRRRPGGPAAGQGLGGGRGGHEALAPREPRGLLGGCAGGEREGDRGAGQRGAGHRGGTLGRRRGGREGCRGPLAVG
jgi:hypothetical protein